MSQNKPVHSPGPSSTVTVSVEEERDLYKEKVDNLKLVVRKLHQDLRSSSLRLKGSETIANLLKDSRIENQILLKENARLTHAVSVLQHRLVKQGASANLSLQDGDELNPGPSRQLLDNLIQENSQLKEIIKFSNCEPERLDELTQEVHRLNKKIDDLMEERSIQRSEVASMRRALNASQDDKTAEILRLRLCINAHEKNKQMSDILCQSMADETMELKQKLAHNLSVQSASLKSGLHGGTTPHTPYQIVCGQNSKNHTIRESSVTAYQEMNPLHEASDAMTEKQYLKTQCSSTSNCSDDSMSKLLRLEEENMFYKANLEKLNTEWQKYDKQREQFVVNLMKEKQALSSELETLKQNKQSRTATGAAPSGGISEQQQRDIDRLLLAAKESKNAVELEKEKLEDEIRGLTKTLQISQEQNGVLQRELEESRSRVQRSPVPQQLEDEIRRLTMTLQITQEQNGVLQRELEESRSRVQRSPAPQPVDQDLLNRIQMLEAQVTIYSEDFASERRDRERAQATIQELESELELYKEHLDAVQGKQCDAVVRERQEIMRQMEAEHHQRELQPRVIARGYGRPGAQSKPVIPAQRYPSYNTNYLAYDQDVSEDMDVVNSLPEPTDTDTPPLIPTEILNCPKCNCPYPVSKHEDFLEHIDQCRG